MVKYDKVSLRLETLCKTFDIKCAYTLVARNVISGITDLIHTSDLDSLAAEISVAMSSQNVEYDRLATAVCVSDLHKNTASRPTFLSFATYAYSLGFISRDFYLLAQRYGEELEQYIKHERDYDYDYAAIKTVINIDLIKYQGKPIERPQWVHIRQALSFYGTVGKTGELEIDMPALVELYDLLSQRICIHGTPTRIGAGRTNNLSSCFLLVAKTNKGVASNLATLQDCAAITECNGGIGLSVSNIPARGTKQPNGRKNPGLIQFMKLCNNVSVYSEDEDKRRGGWALYIEPWHEEIYQAVAVKRKSTLPESACQRLYLALWTCDLFMQRVKDNATWSLFSPDSAPGLYECWGEAFDKLYTKYEAEKRYIRQVKASELWLHILDCIIDSGGPYVMFKDECNRVSNHNHLGTIKSSNLCTEIIQYTSVDETAVCNLGSINLASLVCTPIKEGDDGVDYQLLYKAAYRLTRNLNKVIDLCEYPTVEARTSNLRHRSIGLGFCGLADLFQKLRIPFTSPKARKINKIIMETIYFAGLRASCDLAKELGKTYPSYQGSNLSKGILQFDFYPDTELSGEWDFHTLRQDGKEYGYLNSLVGAPMPTSTCSVLCKVNEGFEPYSDNIFTKNTVSGQYLTVNRNLEQHLGELGLWNSDMLRELAEHKGSVQKIESIPEEVRKIYLTSWEISMKDLADMAADRQPFIDQGQSFSAFFATSNRKELSNYLFYTWNKKLKNGMYYLRTKATISASNILLQSCLSCSV